YPVFSQDGVILEVKYNGFLLSYIKDMLDRVEQSELSVSKYALSRTICLNYVF
ncbi:MAG TPA: molecular chaperone, partial [Clostridia bacterium]|nr:molecular chaperone [Clostridia bacterium]